MQNLFLSALLKLILKRFFYSGYSVAPSDISPSVYKPSQNATNMYKLTHNHLRHDYLIKYAYFVECYLERFASISQ